ncbi:MAG: fatty acid desaturase [Bacteroidota bacterium]
MNSVNDFTYSDEKEPHVLRAKSILKTHPEVKKLMGRNPYTFLIILGVVSVQIALSWVVSNQSWWWVVGAAWCLGAFASHTLFVTIHEATHNLLFKKRWANLVAGMIANIPSLFPTSVSFARYHVKHHAFQGTPEYDADLPSRWEAKLVRGSFIGKVFWLLFYPLVQVFRTFRIKEVKVFDGFLILNWVIQIVAVTAIYTFLGPKAMAYLFMSFFFSLGLHPLGARWVQEHYLTTDTDQETFSYYGIMNIPNLYVGYHNEHHDFPSVPWHNLPKLKSTANEYYRDLAYHTSYSRLFVRFLFDGKISLFSRMIRDGKGKHSPRTEAAPVMSHANEAR